MTAFRVREAVKPSWAGSLAGFCAASREDRPRWFFVTDQGVVFGVDLATGERFFEARVGFSLEPRRGQPVSTLVTLCASDDGRFLAVAQRRGLEGRVFDVTTGASVLELRRGDYHPEHSTFPLCFLDARRLVHGVEWNQLAVTDVVSGRRLTPVDAKWSVDYFFGALERSPSGQRLASPGWVWHPIGYVAAFEVEPWLSGALPEPAVAFSVDSGVWDLPVCWLDEERYATAQAFNDSLLVVTKVGAEEPLFTRKADVGELALRRDELLSLGGPTEAYSHSLEPRASTELKTFAWHPGAQEALSFDSVAGDGPWKLVSRPRPLRAPEGVKALARQVQHALHREARLVLADALDEHGLDPELGRHLRWAHHDAHRCFIVDDLACEPESSS